jgi:sugar O-acyltransferase (sialic acid O-acetyltransferase NeuD family)
MTPLVIIGAGGFARETAELVRAINETSPTYDLLGYLDDEPTLHGRRLTGLEVLGPLDAVHDLTPAAVAVACLGSPASISLRQAVVGRLGLGDDRWATLVHPAATVSGAVRLGAGTVVGAGAVFTADVEVGRHVAVMPCVVLTHDDTVSDHCTFGAGASLAGGVRVGPGAYIGAGATIRQGAEIGAGALIGMGSVVTDAVPGGEVWAGVPARFLRPVSPSETRS